MGCGDVVILSYIPYHTCDNNNVPPRTTSVRLFFLRNWEKSAKGERRASYVRIFFFEGSSQTPQLLFGVSVSPVGVEKQLGSEKNVPGVGCLI